MDKMYDLDLNISCRHVVLIDLHIANLMYSNIVKVTMFLIL